MEQEMVETVLLALEMKSVLRDPWAEIWQDEVKEISTQLVWNMLVHYYALEEKSEKNLRK